MDFQAYNRQRRAEEDYRREFVAAQIKAIHTAAQPSTGYVLRTDKFGKSFYSKADVAPAPQANPFPETMTTRDQSWLDDMNRQRLEQEADRYQKVQAQNIATLKRRAEFEKTRNERYEEKVWGGSNLY